jgi:hypothetical protein
MEKSDLASVLKRAQGWPSERQNELAELALEIEAEIAGIEYDATADELAAIDDALAGGTADDSEVRSAFGRLRGP